MVSGGSACVLTAGLLGVAPPASAHTGVHFEQGSTWSRAMFDVGAGSIRAYQQCSNSTGQTEWWSYGTWKAAGSWSTVSCTYKRYNTGWYQTKH